MRNILLVLFLAGLFSCKEKQLSPEELQPLVGKWRVTAIQPAGKTEWEFVTQSGQHQFEIRYDGVILGPDGLPICCGPKYLKVNGKVFTIVPKEGLPDNPLCALVNCVGCDTLDMDLQGDVLTTNTCNGSGRSRYERI